MKTFTNTLIMILFLLLLFMVMGVIDYKPTTTCTSNTDYMGTSTTTCEKELLR